MREFFKGTGSVKRPVSGHSYRLRGLMVTSIAALGMTSMGDLRTATAQDMSNGASNFYVSDRVTVQRVTFKNQYRMEVVGNLFVPRDLDRTARHAAIVVGHPMGAVKEQSANLDIPLCVDSGRRSA